MPATLLSKTCECDTRSLLAAMNIAVSVVSRRSPKPVLASVLMVIDPENGSFVTGTDLEVGVRCRLVGAKADRAFSVLLNPARVMPILQRADSESVEFTLDEDKLTVRGQGFKFELTTEDPDLYPKADPPRTGGHHEIAAKDLRRLIRTTRFACDPESQRYALGGCLMEPQEGGPTDGPSRFAMVATDGRRLARAGAPCDVKGGGGFTAAGKSSVAPLKALTFLERFLDDDDLPVELRVDQNGLTAACDRLTVWSRLVEGRFPHYQDAFPPPPEATADVKSGILLSRVSLASVTNSEESRGVDFTLGAGCLAMKASAADVGTSEVAMPLNYEGKEVSWTLDGRYLLDALAAVGPDVNLELRVIDGKNGVALQDAEFQYVMMPLTKD
jgi:DNA polymerase III subunit beta